MENENSIVSHAAYNLFYARKDLDFENLDYESIKNILDVSQNNSSSGDINI